MLPPDVNSTLHDLQRQFATHTQKMIKYDEYLRSKEKGIDQSLKEAKDAAVKIVEAAKADTVRKAKEDEKQRAAKMAELDQREIDLQARLSQFDTIEGDLAKFKGRVKLNIGGVKFETTLTTLCERNPDNMLAAMFSGRHDVELDEEKFAFIDRDGTHFNEILNFLRTGNAEWPSLSKARKELTTELDYYQLLDAFRRAAGSTPPDRR